MTQTEEVAQLIAQDDKAGGINHMACHRLENRPVAAREAAATGNHKGVVED